MREITRDQANEIIRKTANGPKQSVVICYAGKWYDVRGASEEELLAFISGLTGIPEAEIPEKSTDVSIWV